MGIIFQFFQLLPTLTLVENVMLPMDLSQVIALDERFDRAMDLLEQVGIADVAHKFPAAVSGGLRHRARAGRRDPVRGGRRFPAVRRCRVERAGW